MPIEISKAAAAIRQIIETPPKSTRTPVIGRSARRWPSLPLIGWWRP